ncbi:hypothetical protein CLD20_00370 [Afifella sp. IM 167]|nr:hypothetical protein [Afifella sp. IM 167]
MQEKDRKMNDARAWELEERLWLEAPGVYDVTLGEGCIMAFRSPVGLLQGADIVKSVAEAPRWTCVAITERHLGRPDGDTVVLGYEAEGRRDGADPYRAICTSTYRRYKDGWKIVQHQQTPLG